MPRTARASRHASLHRLQVFLISKAGTHGINLVSCRRIVVLEENWNPVYNLQVGGWLGRQGEAGWASTPSSLGGVTLLGMRP